MEQRDPHGGRLDREPVVDCAWCARWFPSVVDLIDHVELNHLTSITASPGTAA